MSMHLYRQVTKRRIKSWLAGWRARVNFHKNGVILYIMVVTLSVSLPGFSSGILLAAPCQGLHSSFERVFCSFQWFVVWASTEAEPEGRKCVEVAAFGRWPQEALVGGERRQEGRPGKQKGQVLLSSHQELREPAQTRSRSACTR